MPDLATIKQQHDAYNERLRTKGFTLLSYRVPCCGATQWSRPANPGERWDTLATCTECGALYIKISRDNTIEALSPDDEPEGADHA